MTEILTRVKIFWPQGLRCQSVERPDDQNRVNLFWQVRNPARERSRNLNREVWESPSVLRRRGCQPPDDWNDLLKEAKSAISSLRKAA
ncbi:MAG: hypothetical protein IM550_23030 [Microcystis sp. M54BS1]|nr:hypothetical protein [Microcystis sp. M54BS1]